MDQVFFEEIGFGLVWFEGGIKEILRSKQRNVRRRI